ncbi:MAG: transposase [Oscillospiraceae bacterium]|nr:transposase [Oscillospiraceae bacterium]
MESKDYPERKRHRLQGYDYSSNGYYFVTICTHERKCLLAAVGNAVPGVPQKIVPTKIGEIVLKAWAKMSEVDRNIETDWFCMMPNHIHGIIIIKNQSFTNDETERRGRRSLQSIVRGFKSAVTREYNKLVPEDERNKLWQKSFYDEIIRNQAAYDEISKYIYENPMKWEDDELYC